MLYLYKFLVLCTIIGLVLIHVPQGINAQYQAMHPDTAQARIIADQQSDHKIVVVDPGHGGGEPGTQTLEGRLEKEITLELARSLHQQLSAHIPVRLTRSDDKNITLMARTEKANQEEGDLFISFHVHGGFTPGPGKTINIYYMGLNDRASAPPSVLPMSNLKPSLTPWFQTQYPHLSESKRIAKSLLHQLTSDLPQWTISIESGPIAILAGADMPAILVEIDPPMPIGKAQTTPKSEWMQPVAQSIIRTLETLWENGDNGPIIQDLHE